MIGRDTWVRTTKPSGKGNEFVPAGITGQVFWSGYRGNQPRVGLDLNGEEARIFVDADACATFDPKEDEAGQQRNLFVQQLCRGCEDCDGEGGHVPRSRASCPRCEQMLCPDGCCGCICGNPVFEKEYAKRITPPKPARKLAPSQWDGIAPF